MFCYLKFNTLRPRQNGRHFADDTFKRIFVNENVRISINISLKFVPKGLINNIPALVQIMAWPRPGDKPLSEPMMVSLLTHICVTRPQWFKEIIIYNSKRKLRWPRSTVALKGHHYISFLIAWNKIGACEKKNPMWLCIHNYLACIHNYLVWMHNYLACTHN